MKKTIVIATVLSLIISCRKDDEDQSLQFNGGWKNYKDVIFDGKTGTVSTSEDIACGELLEFTSTTNVRTTEYSSDSNDGNCKKRSVWEGNYSFNESTRIIIIDDEEYSVKNISSTEMQLQFDYYDINNDGVLEKYVVYYKKQ